MIKKNITAIILTFVLFLLLDVNIASRAVGTYKVSTADKAIEKVNDTQYVIPLYITGNKGIMGFRIFLNYDSSKLKIDSVSKGLLTDIGNFNYSILDDSSGQVDVIWHNTEDVTGDGSLMYIGVTVFEEIEEDSVIEVSYSKEDTFNEAWEDVHLNCKNIYLQSGLQDIFSENHSPGDPQHEEKSTEENVDDELKAAMENVKENKFFKEAVTALNPDMENEVKIEDRLVIEAIKSTIKKHDMDMADELPDTLDDEFWTDVKNVLVEDYGVDSETASSISFSDYKMAMVSESMTIESITTENMSGADFGRTNEAPKDSEIEKDDDVIVTFCLAVCVVIIFIFMVVKWRKHV